MSPLAFCPLPRVVRRVFWCAVLVIAVGGQSLHCAWAGEGVSPAVKSQPTTHRPESTISIKPGSLKAFCLAPDGRILAVVHNGNGGPDTSSVISRFFGEPKSRATNVPCTIQVLDSKGKVETAWPVDFLVQAINVGPDGKLYLGGSGLVAKWDLAGKELARAETPALKALKEDPEQLEVRAKEQIESQLKSMQTTLETFKRQKAEYEKKREEITTEDPGAADQENANQDDADTAALRRLKALTARREKARRPTAELQQAQLAGRIPQYETAIEQLKKQDLKTVAEQIGTRVKTINAIACSEHDVFVVSAAAKGYGYTVWRMDRDLQKPKQIVADLIGCCGQMDIHCLGGDLFIAENSRHRVLRLDRDGKQLKSFGKVDRDGVGAGFGGCCNPMNLCFAGTDELYVSESDGQVKLFTPDGEFVGVVGIAGVQPGCKNSAIAVSPDRDKVYYIDIQKSSIIVLARAPSVPAVSEN